jgi:Tfp pilus assembly protein PilZ
VEQRRQLRVARNLLAQITLPTGSFFAYVQDLAKNGVGFTCNRQLAIGDPLAMAINVPGKPTIAVQGKIVWQRSLPVIARNKNQYGFTLTEPSELFDHYVEAQLKRDYERRGDTRYTDFLLVENTDVMDLLDAATADISANGLYIRTGSPLAMGKQIELKLSGPQLANPLFCLAEVVAVFDADPDDLDHPYGAGVRFISFSGDGAAHFKEYLRGLESLFNFHWPPRRETAAPTEVEIEIE